MLRRCLVQLKARTTLNVCRGDQKTFHLGSLRPQDKHGRGDRNSRDRKLDCEAKVLIVMDTIIQAGVNLSDLRINEGERWSEVDIKAGYICVQRRMVITGINKEEKDER